MCLYLAFHIVTKKLLRFGGELRFEVVINIEIGVRDSHCLFAFAIRVLENVTSETLLYSQ